MSSRLSFVSSTRALLDRYCVTCHDGRLRTAGLSLDTMDAARIGDGAEVWEKVVVKLRPMPPPGSRRRWTIWRRPARIRDDRFRFIG